VFVVVPILQEGLSGIGGWAWTDSLEFECSGRLGCCAIPTLDLRAHHKGREVVGSLHASKWAVRYGELRWGLKRSAFGKAWAYLDLDLLMVELRTSSKERFIYLLFRIITIKLYSTALSIR
jgi:hypothetical protein